MANDKDINFLLETLLINFAVNIFQVGRKCTSVSPLNNADSSPTNHAVAAR